MKLQEVKSDLQKEKKVLAVGIVFMLVAAALVLIVMNFSVFSGIAAKLMDTISPVLYGLVIAYILNVFVHFFEDFVFKPFEKNKSAGWKKAKRPLAVALAYLVVCLVIVFITCFIIPGLIESLSVLADTAQKTVPGYVDTFTKRLTKFAMENDLTFIQDFIKGFDWGTMFSNVTKMTSDFVTSLVNVTVNVASAVFTAVMSFIFSIYMLFGKEKLLRGVRSSLLAFLPEKLGHKINRVGAITNRVFFSFIRGQLVECVILGSLCYVGMRVLGLDYALLISSIVTICQLIPILGAYISCVVGAVILLISHPIDALIFVIFLLILQQIEGNLIYPRVVGSSIGLPPVWTLFAVIFWGGILGIPGILIGTPATAVLYRLFRTAVTERLLKKNIDPQDPRLSQPIQIDDMDQQRLDDV